MITALVICGWLTAAGFTQHCAATPAGSAKFDGGLLSHTTVAVPNLPPAAFQGEWSGLVVMGPTPVVEVVKLAENICQLDGMAEQTAQAIAREKANPAGVVDLVTLHQMGEELASYREEAAQAKAQWKASVKRVWVSGVCK